MKGKMAIIPIFVLWLLGGVAICLAAQSRGDKPDTPDDQQAVRQQIAGMIQQAIKRATFRLPEGGSAVTVPVLTTEEYEKIKRLGDKATVILAEYRTSKVFFEQLLAIRLLDAISTDPSKDALDDFAEKAESVATRSYALDFVAHSGRPKDITLLEKIAVSDPDTHVRARALDLIEQRKNT